MPSKRARRRWGGERGGGGGRRGELREGLEGETADGEGGGLSDKGKYVSLATAEEKTLS